MPRDIAEVAAISTTLLTVKHIVQYKQDCFLVRSDRTKNEQTMLSLGFSDRHVGEEILTLTYKNYHKGPEDNRSKDGPSKGEIWVFGKEIAGIEIYIKIHIVPTKRDTHCVCISFHEAEYSLTYPYR